MEDTDPLRLLLDIFALPRGGEIKRGGLGGQGFEKGVSRWQGRPPGSPPRFAEPGAGSRSGARADTESPCQEARPGAPTFRGAPGRRGIQRADWKEETGEGVGGRGSEEGSWPPAPAPRPADSSAPSPDQNVLGLGGPAWERLPPPPRVGRPRVALLGGGSGWHGYQPPPSGLGCSLDIYFLRPLCWVLSLSTAHVLLSP